VERTSLVESSFPDRPPVSLSLSAGDSGIMVLHLPALPALRVGPSECRKKFIILRNKNHRLGIAGYFRPSSATCLEKMEMPSPAP
jgi:hypothetical protein